MYILNQNVLKRLILTNTIGKKQVGNLLPLCENSAGSRIKIKFSNYLLYFQICPECSSFYKQVYVVYKHFLFKLEEHRCGNVLQSYIGALRCFLEVNLQSSTVVSSVVCTRLNQPCKHILLWLEILIKGFKSIISGIAINGSTMTRIFI